MSPLPPPPEGMTARITHEGVVWEVGVRPVAVLVALGVLLAAGAVGVQALDAAPGWTAALGALALGAFALAAVARASRTVVRLTDRAITVEQRTLFGAAVERVPLDELRAATVVPGDEAPETRLVLRHREATVAVGVGRPERELRWMRDAIDAALAVRARREQVEGREWTFLRRTPEELKKIVERP